MKKKHYLLLFIIFIIIGFSVPNSVVLPVDKYGIKNAVYAQENQKTPEVSISPDTKSNLQEKELKTVNKQEKQRSNSTGKKTESSLLEKSEVRVNGEELFPILTSDLDNSAQKRAEMFSERLQAVFDSKDLDPEKFRYEIDKKLDALTLYYGKKFLFRFTKEDAEAYKLTFESMGAESLALVKYAAKKETDKRWAERSRIGLIIAIAGSIFLVLIVILLGKIALWLTQKIESLKDTKIKSITFQKVEIFSSGNILKLIRFLVNALKIALIILLIYVYLHYVLKNLPGTELIQKLLFEQPVQYILKMLKAFVNYLPRLIFIIISVLLIKYILKLNDLIFEGIKKGTIVITGFHEEFHDITKKIVKSFIYFFGLVLIAPNLPGYSSPVFKGLSIFTGVIVSLGSTSFIGNVLAGLTIIYTRTYKMGDWIKIGDDTGEVIEMNLSVTRLSSLNKTDITIPNSIILQKSVINYSTPIPRMKGIMLKTSISIGYDVPGEKVKQLSLQAVKDTDNVLDDPAPFLWQSKLDDFYVVYTICSFTDKPNMMIQISSNINDNIRKRFNEANIEIMSPHYTSLRDGNTSTIPEDKLPVNYKPDVFHIKNV